VGRSADFAEPYPVDFPLKRDRGSKCAVDTQ
jgi:hypothetical protein